MKLILLIGFSLLFSGCVRNSITENELLLKKIRNGNFHQSKIKIDSIFGGNWDTLILMPPYFPTENLLNCGVDKAIIKKIIETSPLQTDIEELRLYAITSNQVYRLRTSKSSYMLLGIAMKGCGILRRGDILIIKNISKDLQSYDFRLYRADE